MRDEFVRRRRWLDDAAFVDLVGASHLIPGPTSSELAMHLGYRRAGWAGFAVAGLAFIAPAVLIVGVLGWIYVESGELPAIQAVLAGVAPVVVAIVAHAGLALGRTVVRGVTTVVLLLVAAALAVAGVPEIVVLLGAGLVAWLAGSWSGPRVAAGVGVVPAFGGRGRTPATVADGPGAAILADPGAAPADVAAPAGLLGAVSLAVSGALAAPGALAIALTFAKIGAVLFGSGYVLVALLRSELVVGQGWLTERELLDAVAIGQATPGPLFSTATFIGYLMQGPVGAVAATVGIFGPAFLAVAVSIPVLERLATSPAARVFREGVNVAAVALIAVVAVRLARSTVDDPLPAAILVVSLVLLVRGVGTSWLIAGGALVGLLGLVWAG